MKRSSVHVIACGGAVCAAVFALAVIGGAQGADASRSLIAIHEHGTNPQLNQSVAVGPRGTFTIELREAPFGPSGTSVIHPSPSNPRDVNGQEQTPFIGSDTLTSRKGRIELRFVGIHIDLNSRLARSGMRVGPTAEYGTWKIASATGIYRGWKGGGNWTSVAYGYRRLQPYSVEWDGYAAAP